MRLEYILTGVAAHFAVRWPERSLTWILVANVANTARALTAAVLIRRFLGFPPRLESIRALVLFILAAALIAPAVGAALGATTVLLHEGPTYWRTWDEWFMSNALTGLTLLPAFVLALVNRGEWTRHQGRGRSAEAIALFIVLVFSAILPHVGMTGGKVPTGLLFYAPLPALIWAALRFGTVGATVALTVVTFAAAGGAYEHTGPFASASPNERVLMLQLFVLLTAIPILCIAVTSSAKHAVVHLHRALLASLHDHIAILDGRGIVLEVNLAWRRFADSPDLPPYKRVHEGDNYLVSLRAAAESGDDEGAARVLAGVRDVLNRTRTRFEVDYDLDRPGRQERYRLSVEALERTDGGFILKRTDLTARRQAELEAEEQRRVLSHLARVSVLGQLSGALAHELNQPLASIASNAQAAQLLLRKHPPDLLELHEILEDIVVDDQRAAQVIRRLRALLKRGEARLQPTAPNELLNEVLDLARTELITRRIGATTSVAPDVPLVLADRVQLQQVLLNLILNACEAIDDAATRDHRLELIVRNESRNQVRFSVRDDGSGIEQALMERLFEPFVTTKTEGMGLGLSMSRTIISAHGGRMWAENNPDRGATVHFVLAAATVPCLPDQEVIGPVVAGGMDGLVMPEGFSAHVAAVMSTASDRNS
jgi:two-component system, LuxR family, sensor kinase FixL